MAMQIQYLHPLITTQQAGVVSSTDARKIADVWGVSVAVIGPATSGSTEYIGSLGFIAHGGVNIGGTIVPFPETSLTRSEHRVERLKAAVEAVAPF
jgi:hypothetical protein